MIKKLPASLFAIVISMSFFGCTKNEFFPASGGDLPANYIIIQADGTFGPAALQVASGSAIVFVNNDTKPHSIQSADSVSIVTNIILPKASYKWKNDALVGSFAYRCLLDSSIKGVIIITP